MVRLSVFESSDRPPRITELAMPEVESNRFFDFRQEVATHFWDKLVTFLSTGENAHDFREISYALAVIFPERKHELPQSPHLEESFSHYVHEIPDIERDFTQLSNLSFLQFMALVRPFHADKVDTLFTTHPQLEKACLDFLENSSDNPSKAAKYAQLLVLAHPPIQKLFSTSFNGVYAHIFKDWQNALRALNNDPSEFHLSVFLQHVMQYRLFIPAERQRTQFELKPQHFRTMLKLTDQYIDTNWDWAGETLLQAAVASASKVDVTNQGLQLMFDAVEPTTTSEVPPVPSQRSF